MNLAPDTIYLHDSIGTFEDDSLNPFESVTWSEEKVSDIDIEYKRVINNTQKLVEVLKIIDTMYIDNKPEDVMNRGVSGFYESKGWNNCLNKMKEKISVGVLET